MAQVETAAARRTVLASGRALRPGVLAYWIQRISGLLLLVLVPLKIYTGYQMVGKVGGPAWLSSAFHLDNTVNTLLMVAVLGHALMGLRVILLEWGLSHNGDRLFSIFSVLWLVLFALGFYFMVAR